MQALLGLRDRNGSRRENSGPRSLSGLGSHREMARSESLEVARSRAQQHPRSPGRSVERVLGCQAAFLLGATGVDDLGFTSYHRRLCQGSELRKSPEHVGAPSGCPCVRVPRQFLLAIHAHASESCGRAGPRLSSRSRSERGGASETGACERKAGVILLAGFFLPEDPRMISKPCLFTAVNPGDRRPVGRSSKRRAPVPCSILILVAILCCLVHSDAAPAPPGARLRAHRHQKLEQSTDVPGQSQPDLGAPPMEVASERREVHDLKRGAFAWKRVRAAAMECLPPRWSGSWFILSMTIRLLGHTCQRRASSWTGPRPGRCERARGPILTEY